MSNFTFRESLDFIVVITIALAAFAFVAYYNLLNPHVTVKYDCSISEISPDYPIEVKEKCRQLRAENFLKDLKKPK